jgi:hypothetical protein
MTDSHDQLIRRLDVDETNNKIQFSKGKSPRLSGVLIQKLVSVEDGQVTGDDLANPNSKPFVLATLYYNGTFAGTIATDGDDWISTENIDRKSVTYPCITLNEGDKEMIMDAFSKFMNEGE